MADSEETLKQADPILEAITNLGNQLGERIDKLEEKFEKKLQAVDVQLEAIREGIVYNSTAMDRLHSSFHANRSDIYELRAEIKEIAEEVRKDKLALK